MKKEKTSWESVLFMSAFVCFMVGALTIISGGLKIIGSVLVGFELEKMCNKKCEEDRYDYGDWEEGKCYCADVKWELKK